MAPNRRFSLALDSLSELNLQSNPEDQPEATTNSPTIQGLLAAHGPLPREALFLGIASDGLPVLLNLHDPHPGPMLIIGEAGSGKTAFLQSVAQSVVQTHKKNEVQSFTREQILSIARKTESLGYDLLSYTRIHVGA